MDALSERQYNDDMTLGQAITKRMEAQQPPLTQADVARLLDVDQTRISVWKNDKGAPSPKNFAKLAEFLDVDETTVVNLAHRSRLRSEVDDTAERFEEIERRLRRIEALVDPHDAGDWATELGAAASRVRFPRNVETEAPVDE